jgi:hypothetical protein
MRWASSSDAIKGKGSAARACVSADCFLGRALQPALRPELRVVSRPALRASDRHEA